ncbi:hypothetical protein AK812_SmicGene10718 [Symbiodinium microadriaticum]|uniref:Uncharacterized protein n=1 Tax=Symbiodinium microadriaticum TaxID=2951 RepID=A0A1Q9EF32_SYMMI|nr:hypothetical protein AK812_SmicGene10718 [Symbiodinium microadriaticum]
MEPEYESPPGLGLDLSVLRAMLGEQADLIRTSSEQNLGKLQGAWIKHFEQLRDKVAAQNTFVQQLSERCRYLEDQLQQLMGARHRAEAATATKVIQNSGSGNVRNALQQLAERSGSETTSAALVTVTPACGNAKKKRARRRNKAKAKHEGFEVQDDLGTWLAEAPWGYQQLAELSVQIWTSSQEQGCEVTWAGAQEGLDSPDQLVFRRRLVSLGGKRVAPPGRVGEIAVAILNRWLMSTDLYDPLWRLRCTKRTPRGGWGSASGDLQEQFMAVVYAHKSMQRWKKEVFASARLSSESRSRCRAGHSPELRTDVESDSRWQQERWHQFVSFGEYLEIAAVTVQETASFEARRLRVRTEGPFCSLAHRRVMDRRADTPHSLLQSFHATRTQERSGSDSTKTLMVAAPIFSELFWLTAQQEVKGRGPEFASTCAHSRMRVLRYFTIFSGKGGFSQKRLLELHQGDGGRYPATTLKKLAACLPDADMELLRRAISSRRARRFKANLTPGQRHAERLPGEMRLTVLRCKWSAGDEVDNGI